MFDNVYQHMWMALPKDIRAHLVIVFDLKLTGITEVIDDRVVSDGYSNTDLQSITLEKMTAYIGSEETFPRAWELTCMKAKTDLNPPAVIQKEETIKNNIETNETNKKSK